MALFSAIIIISIISCVYLNKIENDISYELTLAESTFPDPQCKNNLNNAQQIWKRNELFLKTFLNREKIAEISEEFSVLIASAEADKSEFNDALFRLKEKLNTLISENNINKYSFI